MKAYVPRIPKMWYFLGLAVFKVELLAPEVGSNFKKKIAGNAVSKKIKTATIFGIFLTPPFHHFFFILTRLRQPITPL